MRADYLTYKRAVAASWLGLAVQLAIAATLTIFGILRDNPGMLLGAVLSWGGVLIWLTLAIVFDAHRRERIEAMEAEALAASGGTNSSVFVTQEDLRPAARRLAGLHKYFVPIITLVVGGSLLAIGLWRISAYQQAVLQTKQATGGIVAPPPDPLAAGVIGVALAAVGFLVARYTAGMAKQPAWSNLRAGAAIAAGTSLVGLVIAVAVLVDYLGPDWLVLRLPYIIGGLLVVIGAEMLLNFTLGLYRPRRAGEIPRAAFDSRLLGFVATPDRVAKSISDAINYQLGFDVTGGWFYQLLSRSVAPLLLVGTLIVWLLSAVAVVEPHQRAIVLRFGKPVGQELGPGLHFKAPWPVDRLYVPEFMERNANGVLRVTDRTVTGLRMLDLGTRSSAKTGAILWTNEHPGDEIFQFVRASSPGQRAIAEAAAASAGEQGGSALRSNELVDLAMVSVELPLHFVVSDVKAYSLLGPPELRDQMVLAAAQRTTTRFFQGTYLDQVLGYGRRELGEALRVEVQRALDNLNPGPDGKPIGAGVRVVSVGIAGVHPPKDTASSFEAPVQADARKVANVQTAEADSIQTLTQAVGDHRMAAQIVEELNKLAAMQTSRADPKEIASQEFAVQQLIERAGGRAASLLAAARADRWKSHMDARGRAARYAGQITMYQASPDVFVAGQYFEAMGRVLSGARVFVTGEALGTNWYQVDVTDKDLGTDVFRPVEEQQ